MRIIKCEDCVNFRDGQCVEYGKGRDLALKDCLHNGGFLQYRPREEGRCGITEQEALSGLELAQIAALLKCLKEYEAIGTPSQCKEAMEKQIAKKPSYSGDGYADGYLVYDTYECPTCGKQYEVDYDNYIYCPECGQRLDMTMEEEDE